MEPSRSAAAEGLTLGIWQFPDWISCKGIDPGTFLVFQCWEEFPSLVSCTAAAQPNKAEYWWMLPGHQWQKASTKRAHRASRRLAGLVFFLPGSQMICERIQLIRGQKSKEIPAMSPALPPDSHWLQQWMSFKLS